MQLQDPPEIFERVLPPWVSGGIIERGYYHLGGAVARSVDLAPLATPAALIEAWGLSYEGSPFEVSPTHVDVLRFPQHPLMSLTTPTNAPERPWPTYPLGFLRGREIVPVWMLERTRVPAGAELWRIESSGEQQLLATFDGPARGWLGAAGYFPPVHLVGTRAKWHDLDVPAEIVEGGSAVELVVVGPSAPEGFTAVRADVWRRVVPRDEVTLLFELTLTGVYEGVPCRIIQHTPSQSRLLLLTDDPAEISRLRAEEADIGIYELTAPTESIQDIGGTTRELPPLVNHH